MEAAEAIQESCKRINAIHLPRCNVRALWGNLRLARINQIILLAEWN
jgi:hypothetical protein